MSTVSKTTSNIPDWKLAGGISMVLLSSILTESTIIPSGLAYTLVIGSYVILAIVLIRGRGVSIRIPKWALYLLLPIWIMYSFHLFSPILTGEALLVGMIIRPPIFVSFAIVNLFLIPYFIPVKLFYLPLIISSTILAIISIPTTFGNYQLLGLELSRYAYMTVFSFRLGTITSIFANPNVSAYLFMVGFVASVPLYMKSRNKIGIFVLVVNGLALFLAGSRSGYLGAVAALGFILVYHIDDYDGALTNLALLCYSASVAVGVALLGDFIPRPEFITPTSLGNRPGIWEGSKRALMASPHGYGTGNMSEYLRPYVIQELRGVGIHSAYLRLFLSTGLIGGVAYAVFVVKSLLAAVPHGRDFKSVIVFALAISISTKEIFEGNTIFGISMSSIILSIVYGYAIKNSFIPIRDTN